MSRQERSNTTTAPPVDSRVLRFVSREEQLRLRGQRNYDRYMLFTKGFVERDSPDRALWHWNPLRSQSETMLGTVVMVPFPVARAFSGGDAYENRVRDS
jgi:hypothetical protein